MYNEYYILLYITRCEIREMFLFSKTKKDNEN